MPIARLLTMHPYKLRGVGPEDRLGLFLGLAQQLPVAYGEYRMMGRSLRMRVATRDRVYDPLWLAMSVNPASRTIHLMPAAGSEPVDVLIDDVTEVQVYEVPGAARKMD